ncbi:AMP-binding enzyme family protein (macronuclear) [Tetrahymena thermophila SB210]|uniref:AMP-binding enzyme family protein n=1 Tax=Tetrahymena thermophila (strain SB210) TaxID=312017 RepID=Q22UH9_TETTS|nr:AMP-binding enzyme family protein [Tetrahymena thermophila SB210]EAR88991.2 AMP-binding enzyme family protein [Tetrahymena thermophila SB210]|eukprot:XP_001009236.2 AMP-binding enzyme family protein [Tetrahymena thermophila SB210]
MSVTKADMFSSSFFFNLGQSKQTKKGTFAGFFLTLSIFIVIFSYFVYLTFLYATNRIDPKYRSQTFVTDDLIQLDLSSDIVGFRFEYLANKDVSILEAQQNKKYIVYQAYLNYRSPSFSMMKRIDVVNCTSPQLDGYYCIDYSQVSNYTFEFSTNENIQSQIFLLAYGCLDLDHAKTTIPDNCASQKDIDDMVNGDQAALRIKLLSQQYNTTSKQIEKNYRNNFMYSYPDQALWTQFKAQTQTTSVKEGFLIQSETSFTSLLSYDQINSSFQRSQALNPHGVGPYCKFSIYLDEVYTQIQIQYPTYPEILALVNSILALLMTLGYFGRAIAQNIIKQEFFLLFLQNMYQDTYEQIMQINQIFQKKDGIYFEKKKLKREIGEEYEESNNVQSILVPTFKTKQNSTQNNQSQNQQILNKYLKNEKGQDEIMEYKDSSRGMKSIATNQTDGDDNINYLVKENMGQSNFIENDRLVSPKCLSPLALDSPKYISSNIAESTVQVAKLNNPRKSIRLQRKITLGIGQTKYKSQNPLPSIVESQFPDNEKVLQFKKEVMEKMNKKEISQYFTKKLEVMMNSNVSKNIQKIIFGAKLWKKKEEKKELEFDISVKQLIESQVEKSLDILQLYQDIIFLKKAVMVLLSKDQLAAISLVGCSPYFLSKEISKKNLNASSTQEIRRRNYFEEQFAITLSQELKIKYIQKFLDKCTKDTELNDVDSRILSSIIRNQMEC